MTSENEMIPIIDMEGYEQGEGRRKFTEKFGSALVNVGFAVLTDHTVPHVNITRAYQGTQRLFRLPVETLLTYEQKKIARQRGYTPFGTEGAKDRAQGDLKSSWFTGREYPRNHIGRSYPWYLDNIWPKELPEIKSEILPIYYDLEAMNFELLDILDDFLGTGDLLRSMSVDGPSLLRSIHYPTCTQESIQGSLRSGEHEDINLLTLLPKATKPGLRVKTRSGHWIEPPRTSNSIVVNAGDMLQYFTDGQIISARHRVDNDDIEHDERFSLAFFGHPRGEMILDKKTGKTAAEFLSERLKAIGVAPDGDTKQVA